MKKSHIKKIRWFARILGSLLVLFVLCMFIAYVIEPQGSGKMSMKDIPLMIGMTAMVLGIIVAWFRESIGGLLILGGFFIFFADEMIFNQGFDVWFLIVFPVIGLLHLFCWWHSRRLSPTKAEK